MEPIKKVRKRDGKVVLFQKEKISEAIFKAATAVGGADRSLADDLADAVNIYLTREFSDSIPTVEEIQDIVEKVLIKTGHAKTAKAYIIYRQKRAKVRQVRAGLLPEETKLAAVEAIKIRESTDLALFVRTSQEDIVSWNREKIVDALCRETGISRNIADIIALEIEEEIIASKTQTLTAPLIREMVNAKLVEYGYEEERRRHTRLGLPLYDVRQVITLPNKENANIPHNPEATNLSLSEAIKKEFALLEVFSSDVSDSHLSGDIHLHDLGMIDRPYSFYGDECVYLKAPDGIKNISFAQLFLQSDVIYRENGFEIGLKKNCFVYDKKGWVSLLKVVRHKKENKMLLWIKTADSKSVIVTADHPMLLEDGTILSADGLNAGNRFAVLEKIMIKRGKSFLDLSTAFFGSPRTYFLDKAIVEGKEVLEISTKKIADLKNKGYKIEIPEDSRLYFKDELNRFHSSSISKQPVFWNLTPEFCYLLGMFVAEGHYEKEGVAFTVDDATAKLLGDILSKQSCSYKIVSHGSSRIRVHSVFLKDLFQYYFGIGRGSRYKSLPDEITDWQPELAFGLISGVIDGDGSVKAAEESITNTRVLIRVASRRLINQIQQLLLSEGIKGCTRINNSVGSVRTYKGKKIVQNYEIFGIEFGIPAEKTALFYLSRKLKGLKPITTPIGKGGEIVFIKEIPINDEFVYDITTGSGTFYCNGILVHNCSGQSLEYVKKYGLSLPNALNIAKPAKHPETLLAHMVKFSAALQGHFAGAIGWDAVNYFFAPFLVGMSDKDIKQLAQMMIYEYSQQAVARGGQAIFSDINIYWEVPDHFVKTPAIGPGGQYTGKTYNDYQKEAQKFAWALFEVYLEGDGLGRPFFFPKPLCHLTNKLFVTDGAEDYLTLISRVAAEKGNTYFVFDRGKTAKISECCRLSFILDSQDLSEAVTPWKMRFCALQNVTLNLPRAAYLAEGSEERLFTELDRMLSLTVKAHQQKRIFINRLLALGDKSPLALLTMKQDGETYLRMKRVTYLVGLIGLNELVQSHLGQELHESETALRFGLKVIAHLNLACQRYSKELGMKFVLEQTPAESTAYRLAKLDLAHFPLQAHKVVKGTPDSGGAYYTNSTYYNVSIPLSPVEKVKMEGLFHPLIDAGALTHVWLGESNPDPLALASFVKKTFLHTQNAQIAFSPEFTACLDCGKVIRGLKKQCSYCKEAVA